jgi:deferrochelatase/peroxidase EfeB
VIGEDERAGASSAGVQAGIATPPQTAAAFLSFDVTAGNRRELTDLFRTLT